MNKTSLSILAVAAIFLAGFAAGQAKRTVGTPKSVIHLVALKWKAEASEADRQKAIDGIKVMAEKIPGIKNVWLKTIRVPQGYTSAFAIEFVNQDAADVYRDHPAHAEWEKFYLTLRDSSISVQASN